ncbi:MAG: aminotransferase class I/II-fold pyridoxal phosphate-dependent enzyme [Luteitalea sp.]|nr:aminotransferase class I/II-fold pyridoxal phosphate-dependent enzyme [Luteitalea sp.]
MLLRLDGSGPRYGQITRALCGLIQSGVLAPGTRVPPTRELARDLSCSRNIVLLAYEQLSLEGYLTSRGGAGTFVSPELPIGAPSDARGRKPAAERSVPVILSRQGRRIADIATRAMPASQAVSSVAMNFVYGLCEPDTRMVASIRTAFAATLRQAPFRYPKPAGDEVLRQQLASRLRTNRGIACSAEQVLVTSGTQQALEICARLLVGEGDRVVVEDPTYDSANSVFLAAGAHITRVPVDRHGLVVSALPDDGPPVRLVYVTPSHQFPTGAVMSASRRYALLRWAKHRGAHILEDDYDSEFRYTGRPIEALAALEPESPVIYCGTFAKSLFPSLRLGYLSLPPGLVSAAVGCKWLSDRGSPVILQRIVGQLMATGAYDRHIRRMLRRYRMRRDALVTALQRHFGSAVDVDGADAGLHVVVWLRDLPAERLSALVEACRARGVGIYPLEGGLAVYSEPRAATRPPRRAGLLLGYGLLDVDHIERGVSLLASAYREVGKSRGFPRI